MPAQLHLSPTGTKFLSDCQLFELSLSQASTEIETRALEYQLFCRDENGDSPIQSVQSYEPISISDTIVFDATSLVECIFNCDPPILSVGPTGDIKKQIFIKYRHTSIAVKDCNIVLNPWIEGPTYEVVNSYFQEYQQSSDGLLTDKETVLICRDAYDWILVCGSHTVVIDQFLADGSSTQSSISATDQWINTGPQNLGLSNDVCRYNITANGKTVKYVIKKGSCDGRKMNVYYLEPKGSWSVMSFDCIVREQIKRKFIEICNSGICSEKPYEIISKYGRTAQNLDTWTSMTLDVEMPNRKELQGHIRSFANARKYYAQYPYAEDTLSDYVTPLIPSTAINTYTKGGIIKIQFQAVFGHSLRNGHTLKSRN